MRVASLFTGIGGLEVGFEQAGHQTIMACEIWESAAAVLRKQFPDIPNRKDVTKLKSLPSDAEILMAGFPCQDLSQAGMTAGISGKRSGLVEHVFRLLDRHRVPVVVLENVSFMLQLEKGAAMDRLARAFEERGYRWAYRTINSLAFLPQRRERVFFVASRGGLDPETVLFTSQANPPVKTTKLKTHAHGFYWTEGTRGLGWAPDAIPTLKTGSTVGIPSPPAMLMPDGRIIKPDIRDAERLQGFSVDWTAQAEDRLRWSLVGNAVTVPVAAWLGRQFKEPGLYLGELDSEWPATRAWPRAARFDGVKRVAVGINEFPTWVEREPLHRFLRYEGTLLSERATAGFLARAQNSSLRFVPGFLESVHDHLLRIRTDAQFVARPPQKARRKISPRVGEQPFLFAAE